VGESDLQFRQILDVQNSLHQILRSLDSKMAEIVGRQERIISQVSMAQNSPVNNLNSQQTNQVLKYS
jgi:hypothetical protein